METGTIKITMRLQGARSTMRSMRSVERGMRAVQREGWRQVGERLRAARGLPPRPGWLDEDPPTFAFPAWSPAWRPFDWSVDS